MKKLVLYSSKTGNTKKVADAILETMPKETSIHAVHDLDLFDDYDFIAFGFWVDKGTADKDAIVAIKKIHNKKVAIFMTLGAFPDSDHAKKSMNNIKELFVKNGNEVMGEFTCFGEISPEITKLFESLPKDHSHAMTRERRKLHNAGKGHPDAKDLEQAKTVFKSILAKL